MVRGVYIDRASSGRLLLRRALERYLAEASVTKKPTTSNAERHKAKALIDELGDYSLAAITPDRAAAYRDKRLALGKSASTVRLELALLSHQYTIAIKEWRIGLIDNPVANIRKPAPAKERERRLGPDKEQRLLKACSRHSNPMLAWMVRLALHSGMRTGEIQSLHRDQVDLKRRVVRLSDSKGGGARTVPLTHQALAVVRDALEYPLRPLNTDLLFWSEPGRDGKRRAYEFHPAWRRAYEFHPAWRRAVKAARVANLRFHDLRHEAVSRLIEAGMSDREVAAISGHPSMQMLRRYTHLRAEDLVERLDRLGVR